MLQLALLEERGHRALTAAACMSKELWRGFVGAGASAQHEECCGSKRDGLDW